MDREQGRADRIVAAATKIQARLKADPNHYKADIWKARLAEYEESLNRLSNGDSERPRKSKRVGAKISVPSGLFKMSAQKPGA